MYKLILVATVFVAISAQTLEKDALILKFNKDIRPDGSYNYEYETENRIAAEEVGTPKQIGTEAPVVVRGSYQYTSPEGIPIQIAYVADENGFQPQGNLLPTPPPIPEAILRSLEFIASQQPTGKDIPRRY